MGAGLSVNYGKHTEVFGLGVNPRTANIFNGIPETQNPAKKSQKIRKKWRAENIELRRLPRPH
jgi:hypothetical protein